MNERAPFDVHTEHLHAIVRAAIAGVEPAGLVRAALANAEDDERCVHLLCAGKAAAPMAAAAISFYGRRIRQGLVIAPQPARVLPPFDVVVGGHPLPTADSELAGRRALALAASVQRDERLICFLSGGASALMVAPAAGISLEEKRATTHALLTRGADIGAINTVRKHISDLKGGGLARRSPSGCHTLAISDVVGDDLAIVGSGPGVPDSTYYSDALEILERFGGPGSYPANVVDTLEAGARGERSETLKPDDLGVICATGAVIGGRHDAMKAASQAAESLGYSPVIIEAAVIGKARVAARAFIWTVAAQAGGGPLCFLSSGETTVRVTGSGKGGRNQEFALAAAIELRQLGLRGYLASVGTDGIDGPTDAAGALADSTTMARAERIGLDAAAALHNNDSYTFFLRLGDLLTTGPTGTNVGDLQVFLTV